MPQNWKNNTFNMHSTPPPHRDVLLCPLSSSKLGTSKIVPLIHKVRSSLPARRHRRVPSLALSLTLLRLAVGAARVSLRETDCAHKCRERVARLGRTRAASSDCLRAGSIIYLAERYFSLSHSLSLRWRNWRMWGVGWAAHTLTGFWFSTGDLSGRISRLSEALRGREVISGSEAWRLLW